MQFQLRTQMIVPVCMQEAFAVFEDPRNLAKITPPWLNFRITTPEPFQMQAGALIDYEFRWLHLPLRWRTRITEYEPPFFFTDEQLRGPYKLWRHRHEFHPSEEGALVTDEVHYILPLGALGRFAHRTVVAEQLKQIFRFRQEQLNEMICQGRGRWTDPAITLRDPAPDQ